MTDSERLIARAIGNVTFCPGIGTKRFARDMAWMAEHNPLNPLTPKQAKYLCEVAIKFRRQVPADIVEVARRALAEMEHTESTGEVQRNG